MVVFFLLLLLLPFFFVSPPLQNVISNAMGQHASVAEYGDIAVLSSSSLYRPGERPPTTFLVLSDTHSRHDKIPKDLLPDDPDVVLIHAGDFTMKGTEEEVRDFNAWLGTLPYKTKIVIAGNHDLAMDGRRRNDEHAMEGLLTNCTYLKGSGVSVNGLSIFGTPWMPRREKKYTAFEVDDPAELDLLYSQIPAGVDVLVTHAPPQYILDRSTVMGSHVGSDALRSAVLGRVRPRVHVFGHIHPEYGVHAEAGIVFLNAATCSITYKPKHHPMMFNLASKDDGGVSTAESE